MTSNSCFPKTEMVKKGKMSECLLFLLFKMEPNLGGRREDGGWPQVEQSKFKVILGYMRPHFMKTKQTGADHTDLIPKDLEMAHLHISVEIPRLV